MKWKFSRLIPRTQDRQYEKEQSYSMLILFVTNYVPLDWTFGRDNFSFEHDNMQAIQKEEKLLKLWNRLKIWKGRQWPDLQCINFEKYILKQRKQKKKNVQIKTDKLSIVQTFAIFKLFHKHKINDKYCNGKRPRSCKDVIHLWEWIRTWMCLLSLVKCHSFHWYKTIFKLIISHSICMLWRLNCL